MNILGVEIDNLSRADVLKKISLFLGEEKFHQIATINPEFLVEADRNPEFRKVLNDCDLRVADGAGIWFFGWLRGERVERFAGADLMEEILKMANEQGLSVDLAVRKDGLSSYEEVRSAIVKQFPCLKMRGLDMNPSSLSGNCPPAGEAGKWEMGNSEIVLCNFGAPTQELFLAGLKKEGAGPRICMGVGGSFDYLTGKQKRAPQWMRGIGLEWLWRLFLRPSRIRRIWNATAVFLWKAIAR